MIDIDMPDNCDECRFNTEYDFCKAMPDNFCGNTDNRKRPEWCPLKEQEPRVITREELKQFEGSPCWFESHDTYMGKDGFWIIPAMFRSFFAGTIMSYTSVLGGVEDYGELGLSAYNKAWRCWTARPTDEQRKAVKWNE